MRKKNKNTLNCTPCKHITDFIQKLNKKKPNRYYIDEKEYKAIVKKHLSGE